MDVDKDFLLEQLEIQAQQFENDGDVTSAQMIRDLINKASKEYTDDAFIGVEMKITIDKFDGEYKDGDTPVETIEF